MGCDIVQGYVCARPMPASELVRWWAARPMVIAAQA
jgi:EAL domain-containing protein (putative c-di-GMP-specific phosphodiesterase class I)